MLYKIDSIDQFNNNKQPNDKFNEFKEEFFYIDEDGLLNFIYQSFDKYDGLEDDFLENFSDDMDELSLSELLDYENHLEDLINQFNKEFKSKKKSNDDANKIRLRIKFPEDVVNYLNSHAKLLMKLDYEDEALELIINLCNSLEKENKKFKYMLDFDKVFDLCQKYIIKISENDIYHSNIYDWLEEIIRKNYECSKSMKWLYCDIDFNSMYDTEFTDLICKQIKRYYRRGDLENFLDFKGMFEYLSKTDVVPYIWIEYENDKNNFMYLELIKDKDEYLDEAIDIAEGLLKNRIHKDEVLLILKDLYRKSINKDGFFEVMNEVLLKDNGHTEDFIKEIMELYSKDGWADVKNQFYTKAYPRTACKVAFYEKDKDVFFKKLNGYLTMDYLDDLEEYDTILTENPDETLSVLSKMFLKDFKNARDRNAYAKYLEVTKCMLKYKNGKNALLELMDDLSVQYSNRFAMCDEINLFIDSL